MNDVNKELLAICKRLYDIIEEKNVSYGELSSVTGIPKSAIHRYATGETLKIPLDRVKALAAALGVSAAYIMGWDDQSPSLPDNIVPYRPTGKKVPILGAIACGEPILAAENLDGEIDLPDGVNADFVLRCKGDSMIDARILDGDFVFIREQPQVENGEIAAVLIGEEATLKRVYLNGDQIMLMAANAKYQPFTYSGDQLSDIRILGKAVWFLSKVE